MKWEGREPGRLKKWEIWEAGRLKKWEIREAGRWKKWEVREAGMSTGFVALPDVFACVALLQLNHLTMLALQKCSYDDIIEYDPDDLIIMRTRDNNERTNGDRYPPHWVNGDGGVACLPPI